MIIKLNQKLDLFKVLFLFAHLTDWNPMENVSMRINKIELEDGSDNSFNVYGYLTETYGQGFEKGDNVKVYIRTDRVGGILFHNI